MVCLFRDFSKILLKAIYYRKYPMWSLKSLFPYLIFSKCFDRGFLEFHDLEQRDKNKTVHITHMHIHAQKHTPFPGFAD